MAVKGQLRERRHVSVDMTRGWRLETSPSGSLRPARSISTRLPSFGRDVVVPEIQRQGISGSAMASRSGMRSLFTDCLASYSCFASSPRWMTITDNDESPTSNLLKDNVDHGSATAPEAFTAASPGGAAELANAASDHSALLDHGARVDARAAATSGEPPKRPRHRPKSKSMSFVQTSSSGAWGVATDGDSQWSMERKRDQAALLQWAGSRREIEKEHFKAVAGPMPWKQLLKKLRAQVQWHTQPRVRTADPEWTNYDAQSYAKNFDNGGWRDSCNFTSYFDEEEEDEEKKLGLRETALHTALLQKLYSKRGYESSTSAAAASVPVTPIRPYHANKDFVPIWQRRQSPPPSKLKLTK